MPSCSPFSSMTRISRARIRSLMRIKDLAERLSSAMVLLQMASAAAGSGASGTAAGTRTHPEYSIGLADSNGQAAPVRSMPEPAGKTQRLLVLNRAIPSRRACSSEATGAELRVVPRVKAASTRRPSPSAPPSALIPSIRARTQPIGLEPALNFHRQKILVRAAVRPNRDERLGRVQRDRVQLLANKAPAMRLGLFGGKSAQTRHALVDHWLRNRVLGVQRPARVPGRGENGNRCR